MSYYIYYLFKYIHTTVSIILDCKDIHRRYRRQRSSISTYKKPASPYSVYRVTVYRQESGLHSSICICENRNPEGIKKIEDDKINYSSSIKLESLIFLYELLLSSGCGSIERIVISPEFLP